MNIIFLLILRLKTPGLLQHFVAPIAYAPHLCYTTSTSNFGHDIFIMFQRPWKSPARISFLNFIAFSAKNSLRFLMMLLIHRNFKCPCTCTSCMHTGQMLRYFWNFDKSISYRIHFREFIFIQFLYCLFILTMLKYIQKVLSKAYGLCIFSISSYNQCPCWRNQWPYRPYYKEAV